DSARAVLRSERNPGLSLLVRCSFREPCFFSFPVFVLILNKLKFYVWRNFWMAFLKPANAGADYFGFVSLCKLLFDFRGILFRRSGLKEGPDFGSSPQRFAKVGFRGPI